VKFTVAFFVSENSILGLLAEAAKSDVGVMARSNTAWLTDLADGSAPLAVKILSAGAGYNKPEFVFGG
jgi:hypothetical protein